MVTVALLRELFAHMEWADAAIWRAALLHPQASGDKKLRDLLLHIHVVQRAFLHVWEDRPLVFPEPDGFPDIAAVQRWGAPVYPELRQFLDRVDDSALLRPVSMPWVAEFERRVGSPFAAPTLAETMFQVTSHSTYHRGQVNMRLRQLQGDPPLVDFIAWVWFGKPRPAWAAIS